MLGVKRENNQHWTYAAALWIPVPVCLMSCWHLCRSNKTQCKEQALTLTRHTSLNLTWLDFPPFKLHCQQDTATATTGVTRGPKPPPLWTFFLHQ